MPVAVPAFMVDVEDPHEWAENNYEELGELMRVVEILNTNEVFIEYVFDQGAGWVEVAYEKKDMEMRHLADAADSFGSQTRAVYVYGDHRTVIEQFAEEGEKI